jgi:hypothetical protein
MIDKLAAAALLLASQGASEAGQCIPRGAAGQMAAALVPSLIDALSARCASQLPAGAFLGNGSRAMAERLRSETAAIRDQAVSGILELSGQPATPGEGQDPDQLLATLAAGFTAALDPVQCRSASELLEALSPLPAQNLAQMFGAMVTVAAAAAGDEDAPAICAE